MERRRYGIDGPHTNIKQVGVGFHPSQDPVMELAREIESQKSSRKIWACNTDEDHKANKKARTFNMNNAESEKVVLQPESGDNHGKNSDKSVEELEVFLNAMKYCDMQMRCKEYGLFAAGKKEILQERLFRYLSEHGDSIGTGVLKPTEEDKATTEDEIAIDGVKVPSVQDVETKADDYVNMEDGRPSIEKAPTAMPVEEVATSNLVEPVRVSCAGTMQPTKETTSELLVEEHVKDPPGGFSLERARPAIPIREVGTKSPLRIFVKDAVKQMTHPAQKARLVEHIWASSTDEDHKANKKARTFNMNNAESEKVVLQPESGDNHGKNSDKSVEELEVFLNAMKYRDMQMRCKAYGLFAAGKKEILRERLFRYLSEHGGSIGTGVLKPTEEHTATTEDEMAIDGVKVCATLKSSALLGSTLKTYSAVKKPKSPPRPSQTYSDSDDSEDEDGKGKEELPKWDLEENLRPALHAQYIGKTLDPDEIFGEVHTFDLEAIFGNQMKSEYRSLTSCWTQDRLLAAEKLVYERLRAEQLP